LKVLFVVYHVAYVTADEFGCAYLRAHVHSDFVGLFSFYLSTCLVSISPSVV